MRILSFAASNSRSSINQRLVAHAGEVLKTEFLPEADIKMLDLNNFEMPIYSIDRELDTGIPEAATRFFDEIRTADALLISYAEHNGGYTVAFKNIFDWASRIETQLFQNKPMVILSASVGKTGGASVMATAMNSAPHFGADIKGSLSVGPFAERFEDGALTDPELSGALRSALADLARALWAE